MTLRAVERWVVDRRAEWEARLDRLGDYLEQETSHVYHEEDSAP